MIRRVVWSRTIFEFWQSLGVDVTKKHFSSPIPDLKELARREDLWTEERAALGIDADFEGQLNFLEKIFPQYKDELTFAVHRTDVPHEFYLKNAGFGLEDAGVLHCMIRHFKPRTILEIGSGNSTLVAARAVLLNEKEGFPCKLTAIDPYPRKYLREGIPGFDQLMIQKLEQTDMPWIASEQWASLIETFDDPAELYDRVQNLKLHQAELLEDDTDFEPPWLFFSGITFSGFILAVWALGMLMSCRPPKLQSSRAAVLSKRACRQVIWLVVLIAVLNLYDLTCTLFAHNAGGLWEMNPFVSPIIQQNSMVVIFKLSMTVGAAILLLVTRRHRITQVGSWWAGVLYTVLILRWTMFNSMFL